MENNIKKIVIIGPESTGKSTLCEHLAAYYKTIAVPEFARNYLETYGTNYTYENIYTIAMGQLAAEQEAEKKLTQIQDVNNHNFLFLDTNLYVTKIWSEFVFNKCDNRILTEITKKNYDLYLLCNTDLPWVKDNLREYPNLATRQKLMHFYKEEMTEQKVPWALVNGNNEERFNNAIQIIEALYK